jgi:hypothetical protein
VFEIKKEPVNVIQNFPEFHPTQITAGFKGRTYANPAASCQQTLQKSQLQERLSAGAGYASSRLPIGMSIPLNDIHNLRQAIQPSIDEKGARRTRQLACSA